MAMLPFFAALSAPPGLSAGAVSPGRPDPDAELVLHVSPTGNDSWSGRRADSAGDDGPFATIPRARDAVRALRKSGKDLPTVRVELRGGTYFLDSPLELGPEDSGTKETPVIYCARAGEKAVLSGGRRLPAARWGEVNGLKSWVAEVPDVQSGRWSFRQLFVNGARKPRTRLPESGEYRIESLPGYDSKVGGYAFLAGTMRFVYHGADIQRWHNLRDVEVIGITRWIDNRLPIAGLDPETRTVTFDRGSLFTLAEMSERPSIYWVENVLEALHTPGQWYLDRGAGLLHYLPAPGEEIATSEAIAPRLPQIVRVLGRADAPVHDVHFEGLGFSHTEWRPPPDWASSLQAAVDVPGALSFEHAERCGVVDCGIEKIGTYGIEVGVGCFDLAFERNRIVDMGAGGIKIGHFFSYEPNERGRRREAAMPRGPHSERITVADNLIAHGGRLVASGVGIFVGDNPRIRVVHNHIFDLYYSGISVGSVQDFGPSQATQNSIEHNHVHDLGQGVLSDLAGIYTCSTPGSRVAFNVVHDISRREYGGWGIYPDEGSHDMTVEKNLVYRCQDGAYFGHHNHDIKVENNIFAAGSSAQVERGGTGGFELACRRNLIYSTDGKAVGDYGNDHCGPDVCAFDRNLYWNASGKPLAFGSRSFSEWQAMGQDVHSIVADPLFADPGRGDFTLRPGSPAEQIGFEAWDWRSAGVRAAPADPK